MKVRQASYVQSGVRADQYPSGHLPEIVLVGRSNVGKSSLINTLLNRRNLARTSNSPGKTRTANFYLVNEQFYLVDLPGYGYAQISHGERKRFQRMVHDYVFSREQLVLIIQIVDFRHPPTVLDQEMYGFLHTTSTPKLLVANKVDKIGKSYWDAHSRQVLAGLPGLTANQMALFSAETGQGVDEVWRFISAALNGKVQ